MAEEPASSDESSADADLCPLFEERLVSHSAAEVSFEFAEGLHVTVRQAPETRRTVDDSVPLSSPTERSTRTGVVVWDAAVVLAAMLAEWGKHEGLGRRPDGRLLELGAGGHGICGITALLAGSCSKVVLTDRPPLLEQLQENVRRNLEEAGRLDDCQVQSLVWGEADAVEPEYDVVVAADCVYDVGSAQLLSATIAAALRKPGGVALAAFDRAIGRDAAFRIFLESCAANGLVAEAVEQVRGPYMDSAVAVYRLQHGGAEVASRSHT